MERVGVPYSGKKSLWRSGREVHLVGFTKGLTVVRRHFLYFCLRRNALEQSLAQDVVEFVAVWVDRRDRDRNPFGLGGNSLDSTIEGSLQIGLADAEVCSRQIGKNEADVIHLSNSNEEICKSCGRHDPQVGISDRDSDRIFQIRGKLIEEKHQGITAKELFPSFRPGSAEERRNIFGKLLRFAKLRGNRAPDAAGLIGAAPIESHNAALLELRSRILLGQNFFSQFGIASQKSQRDHAVGFAPAHGLREQEDRRAGTRSPKMAKCSIYQREHPVGKIVLLEEFGTVDLTLQKGFKAENGGPPVGSKDRWAWSAVCVE